MKCGTNCCKKAYRVLIRHLIYTNFSTTLLPTSRSLEVSCFLPLSTLLTFRLYRTDHVSLPLGHDEHLPTQRCNVIPLDTFQYLLHSKFELKRTWPTDWILHCSKWREHTSIRSFCLLRHRELRPESLCFRIRETENKKGCRQGEFG